MSDAVSLRWRHITIGHFHRAEHRYAKKIDGERREARPDRAGDVEDPRNEDTLAWAPTLLVAEQRVLRTGARKVAEATDMGSSREGTIRVVTLRHLSYTNP